MLITCRRQPGVIRVKEALSQLLDVKVLNFAHFSHNNLWDIKLFTWQQFEMPRLDAIREGIGSGRNHGRHIATQIHIMLVWMPPQSTYPTYHLCISSTSARPTGSRLTSYGASHGSRAKDASQTADHRYRPWCRIYCQVGQEDDAMAILMAANNPEVQLLGITTVYGNVPTALATQNALRLLEMTGLSEGPQAVVVVQGAARSLRAGADVERIADFVHGADGFGDIGLPLPKSHHSRDHSAAEFIVRTVNAHPGQVTILALAPLTNIAQALMLDPQLGDKWAELVILGGAFFTGGNVNPSAEANIFGDPDAADLVLGSTSRLHILGLDVTQKCRLTGEQLQEWYDMDAIMLHDPTAMIAVLRPDLFEWRAGAVRVACEGVMKGQTVMDASVKGFHGHHGWADRPKVNVALGVQVDEVVRLICELLTVA
ncbi:hypothetical protein VaNZ11_015291 [Volvox africanus]|uniref:Inosine/uridine-preferring nucleoside hydrolase domain-containing protein n=1 Tax=Volvox africanus TaxID=51714 RepID=A0ABQ5SK22_9CHLO|nr:hypothetical protein VaNZ11_015291 [Volvox africanus]